MWSGKLRGPVVRLPSCQNRVSLRRTIGVRLGPYQAVEIFRISALSFLTAPPDQVRGKLCDVRLYASFAARRTPPHQVWQLWAIVARPPHAETTPMITTGRTLIHPGFSSDCAT